LVAIQAVAEAFEITGREAETNVTGSAGPSHARTCEARVVNGFPIMGTKA